MTWREDKTLIVLCGFVLLFAGATIATAYFPPNNNRADVFSTALLAGAWSALMKHLPGSEQREAPPGTTTVTNTSQVTDTAPEVRP